MPGNTLNKDIRTVGYVLKRTNYGEADRILNLITPLGKKSVIAKGVRKPKSKLAGGIEMFTRSEINIHEGRGEIGVLTGARMNRYYGEIVKDFRKIELAGEMLKRINRTVEGGSEGYFRILEQGLSGLEASEKNEMVFMWFLVNLNREIGEEMNLYRDVSGEKLSAEKKYSWDEYEKAFLENISGEFGANEIKVLRMMNKGDLREILRVRIGDGVLGRVYELVKMADRS